MCQKDPTIYLLCLFISTIVNYKKVVVELDKDVCDTLDDIREEGDEKDQEKKIYLNYIELMGLTINPNVRSER